MDHTAATRRPPFGDNPVVGERGTGTQRRILAAALDVFADVGFHEARVELITERAGCSRPSFYQYFSSKDEVFWALAGRLGRLMVDQADDLGDITPDPAGVAALRAWLDHFADLYADYAPVFSAFQAAIRGQPTVLEGSRSIGDRLADALVRGVGPDHESMDADSVARAMVTVVIRCNFYWRNQLEAIDRGRLVDGLAQTVHRLLVGPIAGVNVVSPTDAAVPRPPTSGHSAGAGAGLEPTSGDTMRHKLLEAGAVVLPARGYHETRVDDIVEEAGVSHGSFYRHFENKHDLFAVLAERAAHEMSDLVDTFPDCTDAAALRGWLHQWLATYRTHGGIFSTWQEIELSDARLQALSQHTLGIVFRRLMAIVDERGFGDSLVDGMVLLSVVERVPYTVIALGATDEDAAVEAMVVIIRRGLMGLADGSGDRR